MDSCPWCGFHYIDVMGGRTLDDAERCPKCSMRIKTGDAGLTRTPGSPLQPQM